VGARLRTLPVLLPATAGFLATAAVVAMPRGATVVVALAVAASVVAFHRTLLSWRWLLGALFLMILFVPIRRYTLGGTSGSFQLEPYRILVAFIIAAWGLSILAERRTRVRRTGFEGPLAMIAFSMLASVGFNTSAIQGLGVTSDVIKSTTFFASFLIIFYIIASVARRTAEIDYLIKVLVCGGTVVAIAAIVEARTGFNVFNHLSKPFPFLKDNTLPDISGDLTGFERGGQARVYASAEHPIALSAAFVMLLPLALYLARKTGQRRWTACGIVLGVGTLGTVSRTGVLMLLAIGVVFLVLRFRETIRFWPLLPVLLLAVHFAMPHTLGILKSSFFPQGGLIAEQSSDPQSTRVQGRVAKIRPTLNQIKQDPLFGVGFGSQIITGPRTNALILDDQWLGTLRETGIVGLFAWLWLTISVIRRGARAAREDDSSRGLLLVALVASFTACAVGMLTFDTLGFVQVTFIFFAIMAFIAMTLNDGENPAARLR
jgi:polysaccharide biosynthesis protein PslJ